MSAWRFAEMLVNGLEVEVDVDRRLVEETLLPALDVAASRPRAQRRAFVFLVGPPGVGKSTLAAVLAEAGSRRLPAPTRLDVVGIDGFHFPQSHLESHHVRTSDGTVPLSTIKGAPETFDVEALAEHLAAAADQDVVWPTYDRRVHDVVAGTHPLSADLVVIEGNWLLLDEPGWRDLARHAHYVVLLTADADLLRDRLVERKVRGGLTPAEAEAFYERSDRLNVQRVMGSSDFSKVDLTLVVQADGSIQQGEM
ncbi:nucleoside/nucleotide kinase family protein [Nocardioides sp. S5]|uniref:nucleoside/nucleotide kinase family protein n=1 Tax=Nocardioides sp. S5 TaxID=2017486 RepID=UPI001A906C22|nr:nucleoside/nucleotide kinase family protein [Nocardioides sp. S5]QSR32081.1 nucleoside/nucleotide kinase family protein [Nocardioides sp. S5]